LRHNVRQRILVRLFLGRKEQMSLEAELCQEPDPFSEFAVSFGTLATPCPKLLDQPR
jgi:hypothetical protein